ncbi:MAG: hypothetical protein ABIO45_09715 [Burkholderiaceae bacterium]
MKTLSPWIVAVLLIPLVGCSILRSGPIHTAELDINEPQPKKCVVNVHVDGGIGFVDQEPAYTKRCGGRELLFQVIGPYKFSGSGIAFKPNSAGHSPMCAPEPRSSKKKIKCTFAPTPPSTPDKILYEVAVEPNVGVGVIKIDPMMIND